MLKKAFESSSMADGPGKLKGQAEKESVKEISVSCIAPI